jgi:FkbM family methyltransferase
MQYKEDKFTTPWGAEVTVFTREGTNDWNTLYSCIVEDEYNVGSLSVPTGSDTYAVDIGGHAGGCSLALLSRGFKVIAVEPLPENTDLIMKNVKANGWENNFTLHKKAINEVSGKQVVLRYGNEQTEVGSHHRFIGNTIDSSDWQENLWTEGREIKVNTISIDDILNKVEEVSILKIDCEGAEWSAFAGASEDSLAKIDKIVAELHALPTTKSMYEEFHQLIGKDFKDTTDKQFANVQNYETIGLAYFEKQ